MDELVSKIEKMRHDFNWKESDSVLVLAKSVVVEAGELLHEMMKEPIDKQTVIDEVADVMMYAISICTDLNVDYKQVIINKIKKVEVKYGKQG